MTLGDVNGDGRLEVVFGTNAGHIYAVAGDTGRDIPNFPFRTHGRIAASVLITQLTQGLSQQLVVMSFDGHLYMVDGISGKFAPAWCNRQDVVKLPVCPKLHSCMCPC